MGGQQSLWGRIWVCSILPPPPGGTAGRTSGRKECSAVECSPPHSLSFSFSLFYRALSPVVAGKEVLPQTVLSASRSVLRCAVVF